MTHRIGECSACGAVFKLPASFAHDQARCTKCGGVVNIAPAGTDAPQPVPAKKVAQKAVPERPAPPPAAAVKRERSGPSMKEQILARKEAAAAGAPAAKPAAPKPAIARPAAAAPAPQRATPPAARPAARATTSVATRATAPSAAPAPAARAKSASAPKPERESARASGGRTRAAASGSRARRAGAQVDEGEVPYRERVKAQRKKSSLVYGIVAILLLGALGGAGYWLLNKEASPAEAGDGDAAKLAGAGAGTEAADPAEGAPATDAGAEVPAEAPPTDEVAAADEAPAAETPKPAKPEKTAESVDLTVIADMAKLPETSDEEWEAIRQDVADGFDLDAGASAGRARGRLETIGKAAIPAILNAFKRVDVTTETGHRVGDLMQKTLEKICNGANYGWKYNDEEGQHYFNKLVIQSWCKKWEVVKDNEAEWLKFSKQTGAAEKPEEEAAGDGSGLDADDFDLDLDDN